jgi:hypothetical protein
VQVTIKRVITVCLKERRTRERGPAALDGAGDEMR